MDFEEMKKKLEIDMGKVGHRDPDLDRILGETILLHLKAPFLILQKLIDATGTKKITIRGNIKSQDEKLRMEFQITKGE